MPAQNIQGTLHVDRYLTNFSVNYVQDAKNFVAHRAASVIPVLKQTDKYVTYDRGYFWRDESQPRPLGGRPVQVGYKVGEGSYGAIEWALEHVIDDRQRANVDDPIKLDENATRLLTQKQLIRADRIWAERMFVAGAWATQPLGVASGQTEGTSFLQFNDDASDPVATIDYYRDLMHRKTGFMPNTIVMGAAVKRRLRLNADIVDRIKYTQLGIVEEDLLAKLFGVDNFVVARSVYNSALEGAADSFEYTTDEKAFWMGYIDPNPGLDSPTAIALFAWTGLLPGVTNAVGGVMQRGRDERAHSDYFQNRMAFDIRQVASDLGIFFRSAVA